MTLKVSVKESHFLGCNAVYSEEPVAFNIKQDNKICGPDGYNCEDDNLRAIYQFYH